MDSRSAPPPDKGLGRCETCGFVIPVRRTTDGEYIPYDSSTHACRAPEFTLIGPDDVGQG